MCLGYIVIRPTEVDSLVRIYRREACLCLLFDYHVGDLCPLRTATASITNKNARDVLRLLSQCILRCARVAGGFMRDLFFGPVYIAHCLVELSRQGVGRLEPEKDQTRKDDGEIGRGSSQATDAKDKNLLDQGTT